MSRQFDVAEADRFRLNARLGRPVEQKHIDSFGKVRLWRPIRGDGKLDTAELVLPVGARRGWVWWCEGDPWTMLKDPLAIDLLIAVAASSHSTVGGRALFLFETTDPDEFLRWKHGIMAEGITSVVGYLSSFEYRRGSLARAGLEKPMGDPDPPTPEVRRLYDGALYHAKMMGVFGHPISWPRSAAASRLPECHWQKWPIQHVLVAGVEGAWDR